MIFNSKLIKKDESNPINEFIFPITDNERYNDNLVPKLIY